MNRTIIFLGGLTVFSCNKREKESTTTNINLYTIESANNRGEKPARLTYTASLEGFLDSVGQLPARPLVDKANFFSDSLFYSPRPLGMTISERDFDLLKIASKKGFMSVKNARRIFNNIGISYDCTTKNVLRTYKKGLTPVEYYPLGGNGFDEFALNIGGSLHCSNACLYFFNKRRIVAQHQGYSHYGLDLAHYKDSSDGKTVVYYRREFTSGSGIWWNNYFFYKYDGNTLIPVLNELQNGNLQSPSPWGVRTYWLESFVEKTNPLTLKMVYYVELPDMTKPDYGSRIVDDSTFVEYTWNEKSKKLEGQYSNSKITKPQLLSYYVQENDLLFINSYYPTLTRTLHNPNTRKSTLIYLKEVRDYYNRRQQAKSGK